MLFRRYVRNAFRVFLVLTALCFIGTVGIFLHSYYLGSYFNVKNFNDPRWRIFDFNSRQATEGEIYNAAEVPAINKVTLVGERKLRFEFIPPVKASSWKVITASDGRVISEGEYPEIQFPNKLLNETYLFVPEDVGLVREMAITIEFFPRENYHKAGLSWGDNYYTPTSEIPFSLKRPYSIDEWAGIADNDPEIIEARLILGDAVDTNAPELEKSEQVFRFIMDKIKDASGIPSDEVQAASPLETYMMLSTGKGKGFCENSALAYYLFANAAGIKTRLVDRAGKFGPLKLTGHYFCESWIPEHAKWVYVDPQTGIAHIKNSDGQPIHTVELKKLVDLNALSVCTAAAYDKDTGQLISRSTGNYYNRLKRGLTGEVVFAYKFGYGNNKTFSKLKNFLFYTTLLYSPFALPKLYLLKYIFLYGFMMSFVLAVMCRLGSVLLRTDKSGVAKRNPAGPEPA